jgi:hypothetical protein
MPKVVSLVTAEIAVFGVRTQLVVLLAIVSPSAKTTDPCIPRAKGPPLCLKIFLKWMNDGIDRTMDKHIPWISVRGGPPKSSPSRSSARAPGSTFEHCCLDMVFWHHNYLFAKWNYSWWCERHRKRCPRWRVRQAARSVVIAMAAMNVGIARAHSVGTEKQASRAVFDSDSFDILVDGGATSCISNDLADFLTPPKDSTVRAKGFNGATG